MSHIALYPDNGSSQLPPAACWQEPGDILAALSRFGIRYARHPLPEGIDSASPPEVLETLGSLVTSLKSAFGYESCDVVKVTAETPDILKARAGFLAEHTHAEDECRLMISGGGSFYLHIGDEVIEAAVRAGDLISVPAGIPHWFDMGPQPAFTALRLFTNPDGWKADFTGDGIALRFNLGEVASPEQTDQPA